MLLPTVLIADDSSNIQKIVTSALQEEGIEVVSVGNGEAAVRKIPDLQPDVILADIFMPVRTGYEVCEFINNNERFSYIPVILLAGQHDLIDDKEVQRVKPYGMLKKPGELAGKDSRLLAMVKEALAKCDEVRPAWVKKPAPKPVAKPAEGKQQTTQRLSADEISRLVAQKQAEERTADKTAMLSREEMAALLGHPVAPPEPAPDEFAARPEPIEIQEGAASPFGELYETPAEEREAPPAESVSQFEGAAAAEELVPMEAAEAEPAAEEVPAAPNWGGITEELKQPSPDEPPIPVQFGEAEPMELITHEQVSPQIEAGPLPELAGAGEWVSGPPPEVVAPPPVAEISAPVESTEAVVEEPPAPVVPFPPIPEEIAPAPEIEAAPEALVAEQPLEPAIPEAPISFVAPAPPDPALVDAIVGKVMAQLGPEILERIAHEIVRPLAEEIARRELEKGRE